MSATSYKHANSLLFSGESEPLVLLAEDAVADEVAMQDAVRALCVANVVIVDDLLATGGTAMAAATLVRQLGGNIIEIDFLIELSFLKGRERLKGLPVFAAISY